MDRDMTMAGMFIVGLVESLVIGLAFGDIYCLSLVAVSLTVALLGFIDSDYYVTLAIMNAIVDGIVIVHAFMHTMSLTYIDRFDYEALIVIVFAVMFNFLAFCVIYWFVLPEDCDEEEEEDNEQVDETVEAEAVENQSI